MAISTLTIKEFITFANISKSELIKYFQRKSPNEIMQLRKNMQVALAIYARKIRKIDLLQLNMLGQLQFMENYCRKIYVTDIKKLMMKKYPEKMKDTQAMKELINKKWENYVKKNSY